MKPKEILIMFAIIIAIITVVFVVAEQQAARRRADYVPIVIDWDNVTDDPSERLEIGWMGIPRFATAKEGTWIETMIEERMNVEFKPVFIDGNAYQRRKPLMFASGLVPDVWWNGDPLDVQRDVYHGFALEIPYEVILKYAPTYVKNMNRVAPDAWLYPFYQGKNYGLPTHGVRNRHPNPGVWRKDWLDKLGIEKIPETLEEMEAALRAIREGDPDGNGEKDTYGMCPNMQVWFMAFSEIFGAYGVLPYDWQVKDGEVVFGGILPEAKEALALLNRWYRDELISPDFVAGQATGSGINKFASGKVGYEFHQGQYRSLDPRIKTSLAFSIQTFSPKAEVVVANFPIGPEGHRGARIWGPGGHAILFGKHLEREPEKVVRVLRMFEEMAKDEEFWLQSRTGVRGEHWDFNQDRGLHHPPPYDQRGEDRKFLLNLQFHTAAGFFCACGAMPDLVDRYTPEAELAFRNRYRKPEWGIEDALGKPGSIASANEYLNDLRQTQLTAYAEMIRGDRPLDYFETFRENWLDQGGRILLEEARELYRAKQRIFRIMGVSEASPSQ